MLKVFILLLISTEAVAFAPRADVLSERLAEVCHRPTATFTNNNGRPRTSLLSENDGKATESTTDNTEISVPASSSLSSPPIVQSAVTPPSTSQAIESKKYPIDLPSPILLGSSMTLAIAATGSLFELLGEGSPKIGFAATAAIVIVGFPACLFLFYASILKAQAETEEDDKKFLSGR